MNVKPKRERPRSKADRRRLCEVNRLLNRRNLPPEQRAKLESERDLLSPVAEESEGTPVASPLPTEQTPPSKETPALAEIASPADDVPDLLAVWDSAVRSSHRQLIAKYPECDLEKIFRFGDPVLRRRDAALLVALETSSPLKQFSERMIWEALCREAPCPLGASIKDEQVAWCFAEADQRFKRHPEWTLKYKSVDGPQVEHQEACFQETEEAPRMLPLAVNRTLSVDPIISAGLDLAHRAELILQNDSCLASLAAFDESLRSTILSEISEQLLTHGNADFAFLAALYERLRPKGKSQFPPRRF